MKKIVYVALVCAVIGYADAVQIKNSLGVGAARNVGGIKVANIGTFGTPYTYGTVTIGGVVVTPAPVSIKACDTTSNDSNCQGVMINPGETKEVSASGTVYIWAYYRDLMVKYSAPVKDFLEFPTDFGTPIDSKAIEMFLR